jgi:hypothetical protein
MSAPNFYAFLFNEVACSIPVVTPFMEILGWGYCVDKPACKVGIVLPMFRAAQPA